MDLLLVFIIGLSEAQHFSTAYQCDNFFCYTLQNIFSFGQKGPTLTQTMMSLKRYNILYSQSVARRYTLKTFQFVRPKNVLGFVPKFRL